MIQYQILRTNTLRVAWQTVRRITNEILKVKGLRLGYKIEILFQNYDFAKDYVTKVLGYCIQ